MCVIFFLHHFSILAAKKEKEVRYVSLRSRFSLLFFFLCFFFLTFKYAYACAIHVLCNHYQLWYSTIIYYTMIKQCRCTRSGRTCTRAFFKCSDNIDPLLRFREHATISLFQNKKKKKKQPRRPPTRAPRSRFFFFFSSSFFFAQRCACSPFSSPARLRTEIVSDERFLPLLFLLFFSFFF